MDTNYTIDHSESGARPLADREGRTWEWRHVIQTGRGADWVRGTALVEIDMDSGRLEQLHYAISTRDGGRVEVWADGGRSDVFRRAADQIANRVQRAPLSESLRRLMLETARLLERRCQETVEVARETPRTEPATVATVAALLL